MPRRLSTRSVCDLRRRGLASVPVFGRYNYSRANPGLPEHRHHGAMEICFLERGRQTYSVGGERFVLRGGDIFLTYPDETHSTGGAPEEKGLLYWMSILDPTATGGLLLDLPPARGRVLWRELIRPGRRVFPAPADFKGHLHRVARLAVHRATPLTALEMTNRLVACLLGLVASRGTPSHQSRSHPLDSVLRHIASRLEEPAELTIEKLAARARLSPSRFKAAFKDHTGIPPAEYVLRLRVEEAARRLRRPGATVTDVAYGLGFSSSQYFASVFKRFTNSNPARLLRL